MNVTLPENTKVHKTWRDIQKQRGAHE